MRTYQLEEGSARRRVQVQCRQQRSEEIWGMMEMTQRMRRRKTTHFGGKKRGIQKRSSWGRCWTSCLLGSLGGPLSPLSRLIFAKCDFWFCLWQNCQQDCYSNIYQQSLKIGICRKGRCFLSIESMQQCILGSSMLFK